MKKRTMMLNLKISFRRKTQRKRNANTKTKEDVKMEKPVTSGIPEILVTTLVNLVLVKILPGVSSVIPTEPVSSGRRKTVASEGTNASSGTHTRIKRPIF